MVDKLNKVNVNVGSVNNDLLKQSSKQEANEQRPIEEEKAPVEYESIDPEKVLDAMKKHGVNNFCQAMASGKIACKSITESMDFFANTITPELHTKLTDRVKNVFKKEFPTADPDPDLITEVVDDIIFDALTA